MKIMFYSVMKDGGIGISTTSNIDSNTIYGKVHTEIVSIEDLRSKVSIAQLAEIKSTRDGFIVLN
jgi:hypothetical protein